VNARWRSEARESADLTRIFVKVGKAIRAARRARKLTLKCLAERALLSSQHLLDIEQGRTNVTLASLVGIARGLRIRIQDLLEGV